MKKKFKIAITGANGYIGSYLAEYLKAKENEIYSLTRKKDLSNYIPYELAGKNDYRKLKGIDVLIHCAHDFSHVDYDSSKKTNLNGTVDLFKNARRYGVKKLIFISSLSAFENAFSDYGKLKYEIESHLKQYDALIVRPGLVFSEDAKGVAGRFIKNSKIIPVVNLKKRTFHPCFLGDLARLVEHLIYHDINISLPIVAASEQVLTFKEYIKKLTQYQNRKVILFSLPYHLLLAGLKIAEFFKIKLGIRSDSLINMKSYNNNIDFSIGKMLGVSFRSL